MSLNDPIADMLTRVRNASRARHETVSMPSSKVKVGLATLFQDEGYINEFSVEEGESFPVLTVTLRYNERRQSAINNLQRISKPGRRIYAKKDRLPRVLGGMGIAVLSTSQGVLTDRKAAEKGLGGEILCYVW